MLYSHIDNNVLISEKKINVFELTFPLMVCHLTLNSNLALDGTCKMILTVKSK